jgi:hypothetical protein
MPDHPNHNSVEIMRAVDGLPRPWRKLVHEYGLKQVLACREDGLSLEDADDALWMGRSSRQAQWLATDYLTKPKSWGRYAAAS